MLNPSSAFDLVDAVYLISVIIDQPRSIDRYIDYFGDGKLALRTGDDGGLLTVYC
jgi:hypothetical protein